MASGQNKINFQVGFSVDKSGLSEMQSLFQQIAYKAQEPGNKMKTGLQEAAKTATTLDNILSKTFNSDLGSLNVTKFNQELAKSGLSLKDVKANLSQAGNQGVTAFNRLSQAILGTNQQIRQSSKMLDQMFTTFKNTVRYGISSSIFNNFTNSISKAFEFSKKLDTSLNDIRIVTDKSAESMAEFAQQANEASKSMGASTLDYTNAALIYYQQGLSDAEVAARAETTIKAANVTGQTGEEVSEQLTAVWNGYKVTAEETELYVDKLAAVAATTAADLEELSVGMSKVASAANAMGVDFDDLNAQIATIVSVTRQAPESVGTALKTIYARLGDLSVEGGVDEFGVTLGKVSEQMQTMGIQILDQNGNLRNMSSVIAEVAQKWGTWTEAQRQAAAVAMAGKRQYNNLIALFDNWDMYTNALETSTDALGTLQHQQDIYMESTAAKLKTLKAAWQGLYDDAINEDEVNAGIEALTNLVEVFDNFIDSFGGGIKSITGFGAIISSVFNKQIADSINSANQRMAVFKNNLALAETKAQQFSIGTGQLGEGATSKQIATAAAAEKELAIAKEIYNVRNGLNQEQAKSLIDQQKEISNLVEQKVILEESVKKKEQTYLTEFSIQEMLNKELSQVEAINATYGQIVEDSKIALQIEEQSAQTVENIIDGYKRADEAKKAIKEEAQQIINLDQKELNNILNQCTSMKKLRAEKENITALIKQALSLSQNQVKEAEQEAASVQRVYDAKSEIYDLDIKIQNKEIEINQTIEQGAMGANIAERITTLTSSLGSMAMAWSSVNSLMETWNNNNIDFGDKITQTFITLGMTIPLVISNFSKLNDILGVNIIATKSFTTAQEIQIAIEKANILAIEANNAMREAQQLEAEGSLFAEEMLTLAEQKQTLANEANTIAIELNNKAKSESIITSQGNYIAKLKEIIAIKNGTSALNAETQAQLMTNAAKLGYIAIAVAVVAAIAAVTKAYDNYVKNQVEANKQSIEEVNAIQDKINANEELYKSYEKLNAQYKQGKIEKEALFEATDELAKKYNIEGANLAKLTGDYTEFTKAVQEAREAELTTAKQATEREVKAAGRNLSRVGQQTKQGTRFGNNYNVNLGGNQNGRYIASDLTAHNIIEETVSNLNVDANDFKAMVKQYEEIQKAVEKMEDTMSDKDLETSQIYKNATTYLDGMAESIEEYKTALEELDDYNFQSVINGYNLEGISSFNEYNEIIKSIRKELLEAFEGDSEKVDKLLDTYLSGIENKFVTMSLGLEELEKKFDKETQDYIESLSDSKKEFLLSGKVKLTFAQTKEDIDKEIQLALNNYGTYDVTSASSLAGTLASGTKLKKKDNQAIQELESEVPELMAGFDQKSTLNQLETIEAVTNYRIEQNQKYLKDWEEVENKKKKLLEEELEHIKENEEYKNLAAAEQKRNLTDEEKEQLEYYKNLESAATNAIGEIQAKLKEGLSFDEIEDIGFSSFIASIDAVTNKAQALQNAAELIGEGFKIAASDVEKFSNIFPELLDQAQVLEDGSLQLNQEVVQQNIEGIKAEMEARNEAKIAEIDQQIELKELEQKYLQEKLNALVEYLNGKKTEQETIDAINQAGFDYENQLMTLTGQEITNLTNHAVASSHTEGTALINMLEQVGKGFAAAANAHYAMIKGEKVNWTGLGGFSGSAQTAEEYASSISEDMAQYYAEHSAVYDEVFNQAKELESQLNTVNGELDQLKAQKAVIESTGKAALHALDNVSQGKAGKDSKSKSGGSKDKDKELKKLEEEFDRYWDIHKALDQIDRDLKKLNKDQENLYGKELIRSLKQENQLLENQAQLYEQLAAAQRAEAEELRGKLALSGVVFDASGAVVNYAEATAAALKAYNDAVQAYNAGLLNDAAFKIHEKAFEEFKKNLERYDTLFYQEMKETQEKIDDIRREMLANNLKAWEVEIQLKLDFKQLERDWNDFIHEVTEDFQSVFKDLRVDLKNMLDDAKTYIGKDGDISTIIKAVKDVTKEIDKMMGGGESDMFESVSQAQEKLKELNQQLLDAGKSLHDLYKEAYENLLDGIDQVADKFDMLMEQFERINDEIEFQKKLIELLYGDEAYDKMSEYYAAVENNTLAQLDSLKKQADMWKEEFEASGATMDNFENWSTEQQKLYEKWIEAQKKLDDMTLEYVELLQNDYLNAIKDIVSQLDKFMTGSTMSKMQEQWEKIKKDSERYYDNVEGAYHIQTLANKIDQSIADAGSLQAQEKLMALRDKEINYLREKKNLTEYDIQAADLRYQLALREIALENAQNNKNSMKLTRNEEGNWSYQYVADEEDVASKRQELLDTYYQLYELADKAYTENIERGIELQEWYDEKVNEISEKYKNDQEKLEEELTALKLEFEEKRRLIAAETAEYQEQLTTAGAGVVWTVYLQDEENYKTMTDNEREMVRKLIENNISDYMGLEEAITNNYNNIGTVAKDTITETREDWNSAAAEMIARWYTDDDSVRAEVERAYQAIIDANNKYQEAVDICAEVVGRDFDNISDALKNAQDETDNLKDKTAEMVQESHGYLSELRGYVNEIAEAWKSVQQEIMNTINLIDQYLRKVGEANAAAQQEAGVGGAGGSGDNKGSKGGDNGSKNPTPVTTPTTEQHYVWDNKGNQWGPFSTLDQAENKARILRNQFDNDKYRDRLPLTVMDTGGYTGSWGDSSGRLAMLHQKELVLNADDTKNFLSGINMIRQLSSGLNGSIENAVLKAVANTALSLGGITSHPSLGSTVSNNSSTDNVFNITAEFPNANNVDDIRQAILSLPNVASQYINSNLR